LEDSDQIHKIDTASSTGFATGGSTSLGHRWVLGSLSVSQTKVGEPRHKDLSWIDNGEKKPYLYHFLHHVWEE